MLRSARGEGTSVQVWIPFHPPAPPETDTGAGAGADTQETPQQSTGQPAARQST